MNDSIDKRNLSFLKALNRVEMSCEGGMVVARSAWLSLLLKYERQKTSEKYEHVTLVSVDV